METLTVVWRLHYLAVPLLGIFTLLLTPHMWGPDWSFLLAVIGSAGLNVAAHLASTKALTLEGASIVAPLLTFSPVFTVLMAAIFLGEIPSTRGLIGTRFLLGGAYWITRSSRGEWLSPLKSLTRKPGVSLVLFARLLWAIAPILEKTAIQHTHPFSPRFAAFIIDLLLILALTTPALRRGGMSFPSRPVHRRELCSWIDCWNRTRLRIYSP